MKGFVPTPDAIVDLMFDKLFHSRWPKPDSAVLDPGSGQGAFVDGLIRWSARTRTPLPRIVGVESDPSHVATARARFAGNPRVEVRHSDFLAPSAERFDYVIGNPPYVPITGLSERERSYYRANFQTAKGRFDLYLLFFEQALTLLKPGGQLVFITPEKFLYVDTAQPLRRLLTGYQIDELHLLPEDTFGELVTYPLVSSICAAPPAQPTKIRRRDGTVASVRLHDHDSSWLPTIAGSVPRLAGLTLGDVCTRVSCGIATGADSIFVIRNVALLPELRRFARPTISGRQLQLTDRIRTSHSLLMPYDQAGRLLDEDELGPLGGFLNEEGRRARLHARTCAARKPWYAFHETPPLADMLRPKLLCKDITGVPAFVADTEGQIAPRHSVYYIVPRDPAVLTDLQVYLNSPTAREWIQHNCQRAASGFLRLQSHTLRRLPLPAEFSVAVESPIANAALSA